MNPYDYKSLIGDEEFEGPWCEDCECPCDECGHDEAE